MFYMRTTLDIPEDLLAEAQKHLGFKSKTDTIIFALREMLRLRRVEELKSLLGSIDLKIDLDHSRRRPTKSK